MDLRDRPGLTIAELQRLIDDTRKVTGGHEPEELVLAPDQWRDIQHSVIDGPIPHGPPADGDLVFGIPIRVEPDGRTPRQRQVEWEMNRRTRQIRGLHIREVSPAVRRYLEDGSWQELAAETVHFDGVLEP